VKTYKQFEKLFIDNNFKEINESSNSQKFYYLRTISRSSDINAFCSTYKINLNGLRNVDKLEYLLRDSSVTNEMIKTFIKNSYINQSKQRNLTATELVMELNRVQNFDWGGSYGNSLEKNIVNNYIKKITSFDILNDKLDSELYASLKGYTINSWYNHWSSILIEDIFKTHKNVLPTVGLVKKIDFFVNGIPFDLKVTYFPKELMKAKLRELGFGVELTRVKQAARNANIPIDNRLKDDVLNVQLQTLLEEISDKDSLSFIKELRSTKAKIIDDAKKKPDELIRWLYENQGEARFDAANRLFLILTDKEKYFESWKLKRNNALLKSKIHNKLDNMKANNVKKIHFNRKPTSTSYEVISDIIFIDKT